MKLSFEQIRSVTSGAVRIEQQEDGIHYHFDDRAENWGGNTEELFGGKYEKCRYSYLHRRKGVIFN